MKTKRVFLIVLDSCGAGELSDAAQFGDVGANTLRSVSRSEKLCIPTLRKLGIGNIHGLDFLGTTPEPLAAVGRLAEQSRGKDTTTGHWEIAGIISKQAMPTYPNGFPDDVISEFAAATGRGVLCNKPYSGTQVIHDYGREQLATGKLIVYTSADSVFQIAAHEDMIPVEQLYEYCRMARRILTGKNAVGRVIARPYVGEYPDFVRTPRRHDFSLAPTGPTMLDALHAVGLDTIGVGKISDSFAGTSISRSYVTHGNAEGMKVTSDIANEDFGGICFVNLVDFDTLYGHRRDVDGYAAALTEFDGWLDGFIRTMRSDDVLMITADHGCDPAFTATTDHTREYIPLLVYGQNICPVALGTRLTFADIGATVAGLFGLKYETEGHSCCNEVRK